MQTHESQSELISKIVDGFQENFKCQKTILSFDEYLDLVANNPQKLCRNSAQYIKEMIDYFGVEQRVYGHGERCRCFKLFERKNRRTRPSIVGQDAAHESIYSVIEQFVRQGRVDKLILLHGPNGSSKSTTADALASGLEEYSRTDEGAVYKFNWIFPTDKIGHEGLSDVKNAKKIGFFEEKKSGSSEGSFAHLGDEEILCKIVSEMKENPIFILPAPERMKFLRRAYGSVLKKEISNEDLSPHLEEGALSSKNKKIFDALLVAYNGDLARVLKHVQVERFFFSSRYRVGIATIEPQMHMDAQDRQLTLERSVQNLPTVLQNIRIFEPSGELIDANRGFIEFADLLKRPIDAFKYLLTTIENMSLNLLSGMADLDLIMMASANEKHLDAFKGAPDWPSFKGRFELVRVPYLLSSKLEQNIYIEDIKCIESTKPLGPHALELLAKWAVLTRIKEPEVDYYSQKYTSLIEKINPFDKLALYDGDEPSELFSELEKHELKKLAAEIRREGQMSLAYEGRFGASPREIKMMLYFASQRPNRDCVSALSIFEEIDELVSDKSVYEYLQFEPVKSYHDVGEFLRYIKTLYAKTFSHEFLSALNLFNEDQYARAFDKYLQHVVAFIRKEKIYNEITHKVEEADENMMLEIENFIGVVGERQTVREAIMAKLASWKVDNKNETLQIKKVFADEIRKISKNIYDSKRSYIEKIRDGILMLENEDYQKLPKDLYDACETTLNNLHVNFGYTRKNSWESLVFTRKHEFI